MAQNVKKKKRSNYDDKLIKIIAISLSVAIVAIVAVAIFISYNGSYVAKVDGERIMKYEYEYFLTNTMYEMKQDAIDAGTLAKDADAAAIAAFWNPERKKEAENKALEEAKKWKAQYILAKEAGFDLDYEERENSRANIEYNLYSSYQQYSSYYTYEQFAEMYLGMALADYQEIAIQDAAISAYKAELKKAYSATDDELKAFYNQNPNNYRKISLEILDLAKPQRPVEVIRPELGTDKKESDFASFTEWNKYSESVRTYNKYLEDLKNYENILKQLTYRCDAIIESLNSTGKYTEANYTGDGYLYNDAKLEDIAKKESSIFQEEGGKYTVYNGTKSYLDVYDEIAYSMQWKDSNRNIIICNYNNGSEYVDCTGGETVNGITCTKYFLIEDDCYWYVMRCTGIEDFENSIETEPGSADSIKDNVKAELYDYKANAELDAKIAAENRFNITNKNQTAIDAILNNTSWS